jgi:6-phosphogluconolactonase (cycloisomerase 2 family)
MLWHKAQGAGGVGGASGWSISNASYSGTSFSVGTQETNPQGVEFKPDGTKMYITGTSGDDVNEYSLSTAWDISTASYVRNFSISSYETFPSGIRFKPDGTKMYIFGGYGTTEYSLSTAWNISTASYEAQYDTTNGAVNDGGFVQPDGTKLYVVDTTYDDVVKFTLSTAWDVSTTYLNVSEPGSFAIDVGSQEANPRDIFFKNDGTKMFIIGNTSDSVHEYTLSTPWYLNSVSYVGSFSVNSQDGSARGLYINPDGDKMFIVGDVNNAVFAYDL